jgi:hypothetical protein
VIDVAALSIVIGVLNGWLDGRERGADAYLIAENRRLLPQRVDVHAPTHRDDLEISPLLVPRRSTFQSAIDRSAGLRPKLR